MRTIFEAVRLIDGVADAAREDVDVIVDGERIAAIVDHGSPHPPGADDDGEVAVIDGRATDPAPGADRRPRALHVRPDRGLDRDDRPALGRRDRAGRRRSRRAGACGRV